MIINLDTDNPKPIEQKVQELILKKLYIKVDDEKIFIDKDVFISLILKDVIAIAKADYDIEPALKIALEDQKHYQSASEAKRTELEEATEEFKVEIDAYVTYLEYLEDDDYNDDDIYSTVLSILNSEHELLEKKLHELMMESLGNRFSEADALIMGADRWSALDNFANQVKLIASYDSMEESVDAAYDEFEDYPEKHLVKKTSIKNEFERFAPLANEEISAYKMALSMEDQDAEFPMILALVKQLLKLEQQ